MIPKNKEMVMMTPNEYEKILATIEAMRKEVYAWNNRLIAEGKAKTHLQNLPPWTLKSYPYNMGNLEQTLSMLIRYFNDCYLKEICLIIRGGQLITQVPDWPRATRDIIDALNNTGQLMREVMYVHKQLRLIMIDAPTLPQSANIGQVINTLTGLCYNLKIQSRIKVNKSCKNMDQLMILPRYM